jgi:YcaO-like protein with predicted kinase domain
MLHAGVTADLVDDCHETEQLQLALSRDDVFGRLAGTIGVSRLANVTGLDVVGIPTVTAVRPAARSLCISQGKGLTLEQARISAIMEAAELHFAERCFDLPGYQVLDDSFGQSRGSLPATEVFSEKTVRLPVELVSMDQRVLATGDHISFPATSTGLAAGLTGAAAIFHALTEVIERDAHSLWRHLPVNAKLATLVDHHAITDASTQALISKFKKAGYDACLWDLTSDVGIPVYMAEFYEISDGFGFYWPYSFGTGCDASPIRALQKAICEAAQIRLTYIAGARDDLAWQEYAVTFEHVASNRRALAAAGVKRNRRLEEEWHPATTTDAVHDLGQRLAARNIGQVLAVTLNAESDPVHVVKVLVPSLEDSIGEDDKPLSDLGRTRLASMLQSP